MPSKPAQSVDLLDMHAVNDVPPISVGSFFEPNLMNDDGDQSFLGSLYNSASSAVGLAAKQLAASMIEELPSFGASMIQGLFGA